MNTTMIRIFMIAFVAMLMFPLPSAAFGLKTHLWIGQQMLTEIRSSCSFIIGHVRLPLRKDLCESILGNPGAFLAGTLGPDVYPDLITGQVTTHPGIKGDWQTADWLIHMYADASPGADLAFAAGYLVHASSDVFAHTYVNGYSGDIFVLEGERAVERRHFVLEKYIDARLPSVSIAASDIDPPVDLVADKLIFNSSAGRLADKSGAAAHISAMNGVRISVEDLEDKLDHLEAEAGKVLADIIATYVDTQAKFASGEMELAIVNKTLQAHEQQLALQQTVFETAEKSFNDAINAYEHNRSLINQYTMEAQIARTAAETAQKAGHDATNLAVDLQKKLNDLNGTIANTPKEITTTVCHKESYEGACELISLGGLNPFTREVCKTLYRNVCTAITSISNVWADLNNQVTGAKNQLADAQARAAHAAIDVTTNTAKEAAALQAKAAEESQTATLNLAHYAAKSAFDLERERLAIEMKATGELQEQAHKLEESIAALRKQIVDAESMRDAIKQIVADSDVLSGYAHNWVNGIRVAGREYVLTSNRVGTGIIFGDANLFSEYLHWLKCYGSAFTPKPYQIDEAVCKADTFYEDMNAKIEKMAVEVLPSPAKEIFQQAIDIKAKFKEEVTNAVEKGGLELAKLAAPDKTTADFIDLLANPENATAEKLDSVFATVGDAGGKDLLTFNSISSQIDADLHLLGGKLDPETFAPLHHANQLARLALVDESSVRNLIWVRGGDAAKLPASQTPGRYSILYSMIRSIDGNHQWQPYGLPYPRAVSDAQPIDPNERHYGYGITEPQYGFTLFSDPDLRRQVFLPIFNQRVSGSLTNHPRMAPGVYKFPECARNPFPLAANSNGAPASGDDTCSGPGADTAPEVETVSLWRQLRNRLGLAPY